MAVMHTILNLHKKEGKCEKREREGGVEGEKEEWRGISEPSVRNGGGERRVRKTNLKINYKIRHSLKKAVNIMLKKQI